MQLILDTDSTHKDMSTIEETLSDCAVLVNGNKENIGEENIIISDDGDLKTTLKKMTEPATDKRPVGLQETSLNDEKEDLADHLASDKEPTHESQKNGLVEYMKEDSSQNIDHTTEHIGQENNRVSDTNSLKQIANLENTDNSGDVHREDSENTDKPLKNINDDVHVSSSEPSESHEKYQDGCEPEDKIAKESDNLPEKSVNETSDPHNKDEISEINSVNETNFLDNFDTQAKNDSDVKVDAELKKSNDITLEDNDENRGHAIENDEDMSNKLDINKPSDHNTENITTETVNFKTNLASENKDDIHDASKDIQEVESNNDALLNDSENPAQLIGSYSEKSCELSRADTESDEKHIEEVSCENVDLNKEPNESEAINLNEVMEVDDKIDETENSNEVHSNPILESITDKVTNNSKDNVTATVDASHQKNNISEEPLFEEIKKDSDVKTLTLNAEEKNNGALLDIVEKSVPSLVNDKMDAEEIKDVLEDISNEPPVNQDKIESAIVGLTETINEETKGIKGNHNNDGSTSVKHIESEKSISIELKDEMDVEEVKKTLEDSKTSTSEVIPVAEIVCTTPLNVTNKPTISKLSNTLDILSDDEEEPAKDKLPSKEPQLQSKSSSDKLCINIEDDDDIMVIDEEVSTKPEVNKTDIEESIPPVKTSQKSEPCTDKEAHEEDLKETEKLFTSKIEEKGAEPTNPALESNVEIDIKDKQIDDKLEKPQLPLLPDDFLKTAKKSIADMTRDELEEFCVLKIVESIVDRSNLSEFKNKIKNMAQSIDEYRKKAMMLTKQNRDLQVVLKSVQEEQKKATDLPITPLKITRSVGMQVLMTDKMNARRKGPAPQPQSPNATNPIIYNRLNTRNSTPPNSRPQKQTPTNPIPVPRLVPANNPVVKSPSTAPQIVQGTTPTKPNASTPNGIRNTSNGPKQAEKRQHTRLQSVTVDLTDDEPPAKINTRSSPAPPVRLVSTQNLMQAKPSFTPPGNSPRKVYIPISAQNQTLRPGQTIMVKSVQQGLRPRVPTPQVARMPPVGPIRMSRVTSGSGRHPAPLPDAMKQYQPPNWKALPPAPDLRLSKVENGIVISWKIEGYQEDSYEEIASYQLYAYQETSSPPSTALWKKIGDVKALPLPMACTLTQFMAGFKYYFAVRAVDVKSRLGPFSLPGSILLLNKL